MAGVDIDVGMVDTVLARRSADSGVAVAEPWHGTAAGILASEPAPKCMRCCYLLASNRAAQRANQIYRKQKKHEPVVAARKYSLSACKTGRNVDDVIV